MKPAATPSTAPARIGLTRDRAGWRERSARLYEELGRPARAMVRRAFRGMFSDDELDDIYSSAWVGVLRALATRQAELSDEEIRKYVFTAVANQAGKEIRRRGRKPTSPLELVDRVADVASTPDERAVDAEQSRVTRDLLASMSSRRRAVIMLRYGWGLNPGQICDLIKGLSPRAYRKEITKGVDELTEKMRRFEQGRWCGDREPLLKAYAAGLADSDQRRQAEAHLSHCRDCTHFVAGLAGRLHDLGGALATSGAIEGIDDRLSLGDRIGELGDRARDSLSGLFSRGADVGPDAVASGAAATGARGAGAAGAGVFAKVAGLGTAGKLAVACVGGGAAATACIAAGLGPIAFEDQPAGPGDERPPRPRSVAVALPETLPSQLGNAIAAPAPASEAPSGGGGQADGTGPAAEPEVAEPVISPATPPQEQEFGVASAAPAPTASEPSGTTTDQPAGDTTVQQEFGP